MSDHTDLLWVFQMEATDPSITYLDGNERVWIGPKWDIAETGGRFELYRKGNWQITVRSLDLAFAIIADQEHADVGWRLVRTDKPVGEA